MILVVDSSVVCKWFIEEAGTREAEELAASGATLIAPDLVIAEVCNVAWKKVQRKEIGVEHAEAMLAGLESQFDELVPGADLAVRAFSLAAALGHPAYDCFYLALAEARSATFVTADARFLDRLAGTQWAAFASPLMPGFANA